jgi:ceramide glucosyltransferase
LEHYYRWQKTIRWCQPAGFAATLLILPLLGWVGGLATAPANRLLLVGLVGQWLGEILVGAVLCALVGCRFPPRTWMGLVCWPVIRAAAWLTAWLPLPVVWDRRGPAWFAPRWKI